MSAWVHGRLRVRLLHMAIAWSAHSLIRINLSCNIIVYVWYKTQAILLVMVADVLSYLKVVLLPLLGQHSRKLFVLDPLFL